MLVRWLPRRLVSQSGLAGVQKHKTACHRCVRLVELRLRGAERSKTG
ncbi:MAG TPA: hypothetical protein VMD29_15285 [Terracidiphilus sp.]|nr:hypothetical protein [Terracidiphilus sp.]